MKKILAALLAVSLAAAPSASATAGITAADTGNTEVNYIYGDVDLNHDLTASDALAILKHVVKLDEFADLLVLELADCTHDGSIGADDALFVLRCVVKLADQECYEQPSESEAVKSDVPAESDTPNESDAPIVSDMPEKSDAPAESDQPGVSDAPTESAEPVEPSESPASSVEPTESDQPVVGPTQTPEVTSEPSAKPTESPLPDETTAPAEKTVTPGESSAPAESDEPVIGPTQTPAPTDTPIPTVEPTATPIIGSTQTPTPEPTETPSPELTETAVTCEHDWLATSMPVTITDQVAYDLVIHESVYKCSCGRIFDTMDELEVHQEEAWDLVRQHLYYSDSLGHNPVAEVIYTYETVGDVTYSDHYTQYFCFCGNSGKAADHLNAAWDEAACNRFPELHNCVFDESAKSYVCSCGFTYYTGLYNLGGKNYNDLSYSGVKEGHCTNYACNGWTAQEVERTKHFDAVTHEETACRVCSKCGEVRFYPYDEADCDGHEWVLSTKKVTVVDEEEHDTTDTYSFYECACGRKLFTIDEYNEHVSEFLQVLDYHKSTEHQAKGYTVTYDKDTGIYSCTCGWKRQGSCGGSTVRSNNIRAVHVDAVTHEEYAGTIVCSKCGAVKECINPDTCTHDEAYRYVAREAWDEEVEEKHDVCECGFDCGIDGDDDAVFAVWEEHLSQYDSSEWTNHGVRIKTATVVYHHPETYRCALCGEYIDNND